MNAKNKTIANAWRTKMMKLKKQKEIFMVSFLNFWWGSELEKTKEEKLRKNYVRQKTGFVLKKKTGKHGDISVMERGKKCIYELKLIK